MDRSGRTCILASTCKKTLNFCNLKNGFNNPNAHLYIIPFYGIVYVQSSENEDYYEEEIIETISESTSANIAAEKDRWTTIEDIIPFDLKEATPGF